MYNGGMSVISASDARRTLPEQLDRVENGERVSITRHGRVVADLVSPEVIAQRSSAQRQADLLAERLEAARNHPLPLPPIDAARADDLVAQLEADRGRR